MTIHLISYTSSGLSLIDDITPCFSPVKIYIPWGANLPEYIDHKEIIVSYPPEKYKPEADFNRLLDECFNWAYEQGEKSRKEIIKTGHINPTSSESLRHIKSILTSRISDTSEKDMMLRWHMLLHLANMLEENRNDANLMLENLKKQPSPLLNNADLTESTRYPLENLREIEPEFFINDTNMKQLLRAWLGLFNSLIDQGDMILTIDRRIFEYLAEEWDLFNGNGSIEKNGVISFKSPLFKRSDKYRTDSEGNITIDTDIRNILCSDLKPEDKIAEVKKVTAEFESMFQTEQKEGHIVFSMFFFQTSGDAEERESYIKFFSDRVMILAEINA